MQMMDVDKLIPHEKNSYFFDDMTGEAWMAFLESVETSGIIEPIVVTESSHIIISGHQRVRAARHFKMKQVPVTFREYISDDEVLKQLIETNIRQRGIGNTNSIKFGRCLKELDRIYGVRIGSAGGTGANQYTKQLQVQNSLQAKTQADIASEIGISVDVYKRYEALTNLVPEIADMVDNGITMSSAVAIARKLSPEQQTELAKTLRPVIEEKGSVSGQTVNQEIKFYKDRIQKLSDENADLRNRKPEIRTVTETVEVIPDNYEKLQRDNATMHSANERLKKERQEYLDGMNEAKKRVEELEKREGISSMKERLALESEYLETQITTFIRNTGGYVWITERLGELSDDKRQSVIRAIKNINAWSQQMIMNIGGVLYE